MLQQLLPFTVLKLFNPDLICFFINVATALTVYGIETLECFKLKVAIVVATVLTVYGIETKIRLQHYPLSCSLQQSLPFTVLKLDYCKQTTEVVTGCNSPYRLRY